MIHYFLWTDLGFLGVLCFATIFLLKALRKQHIRSAFQSMLKKPIAVSALIILAFFLMIAVLDSLHFSKRATVLDELLAPLGEQYEKTYSAPMALTLYSSEIVLKNGHLQSVFLPLEYTKHIKNADEKSRYIIYAVTWGLGGGLFFLAGLLCATASVRWMFRGKVDLGLSKCACSTYITLFACLSLLIGSYLLSRQFHLLGTGKIGQDIFYYSLKSIHTGLVIGLLTTLVMMPLALLLGVAAGYFGGIVDDVIQYIYTTLSSIPGVLLISASVLSMQVYIANHPEQFKTLAENADARLIALCFILGVTSWTTLCRLLRAEALKLREIDFVLAAKVLCTSSFQIITKHLLPNVMHIVLITLVLDFSYLVLAEAVLSYVGVGVSPMTISWGNMINAARLELAREPIVWWPIVSAFVFMFTLVLASNLVADALQDAFDPHRSRS